MKSKILLLLCCLPLLAGCAHIAVAQAQKEMQSTLDSLMGCSEEEVIILLGVPQNIQNIGELKVYQYRQSYGTRTNAYANAIGTATIGNANVWESYDTAEIVFKDGCAISWKGYVQR